MAKAKCPKKQNQQNQQNQQSNMNISAPMIRSSATGTKVIFEHNVQIGNRNYKKGQVAFFDTIEGFKRFVSVVE